MNVRRLVALAMFVGPMVAVAVACTFPDVTFGLEDGASEGGGGDAAGRPDAAADDARDADVVGDVVTREDGRAPIVDASACATRVECDCDEDGYADERCDVDAAAILSAKGQPLKPGDCDDMDYLRHPEQDYVDEVPPPGKDGDWDCDGIVESPYPSGAGWCTGTPLLGCRGGPGYQKATVSCGELADFYTCEPSGLACSQKLVPPPAPQKQKKLCK